MPEFGIGYVAEADTKVIAMAFGISGMSVSDGAKLLPCCYIYAVATAVEYRGNRIASELCIKCAEACRNENTIVFTKPASDSLYKYYEKVLNTDRLYYEDCVFSQLRVCNISEDKSLSNPITMKSISSDLYNSYREKALKFIPHLSLSDSCIEYERALCKAYDGDIYLGDTFIISCYKHNGTLRIIELLPISHCIIKEIKDLRSFYSDKAAVIASFFGCSSYEYSLPVSSCALNSGVESYKNVKKSICSTNCFAASDTIWNILFD